MEINFKSPKTVLKGMQVFQKRVHHDIEQTIVSLVNARGGYIEVREDPYHGYPTIYSDDGRCSIMELKKVSIVKSGRNEGRLYLWTDDLSSMRQPHCNSLSIGEMLQIWDIILKNTK